MIDPRALAAIVRTEAGALIEAAKADLLAEVQKRLTSVQNYLATPVASVPQINLASPGPIGSTTPSTGNFTALTGTSVSTPTLGSSSGLQNSIPSVGGDTFTLNGAAQVLASKTLTAPVLNGATSASGNFDLSGSSGTQKSTTGAQTIGPGAITLSGDVTVSSGKKLSAPTFGVDGSHQNAPPAVNGDTYAVLGNLPALTWGGTVDMTGNAPVYLGGNGLVFSSQAASVGIPPGAQTRTVTNCCVVMDTADTSANIQVLLYYSSDGASWSVVANSTQTLNANSRVVKSALSGTASLDATYFYQVRLFPSAAASATHKVAVSYY